MSFENKEDRPETADTSTTHLAHAPEVVGSPASNHLTANPSDPTEDGAIQFSVFNPVNGKSVLITAGRLKDDLRLEEKSVTPDITRINDALRWMGNGDKNNFIQKHGLGGTKQEF